MRTLSNSSKVIMLLCARLGASGAETLPVLSLTEYNAVAEILHAADLTPGDLLYSNGQAAIANAVLPRKLTVERLMKLLDRGAALGFELDTLSRQGISVLCRSEGEYPWRLREHLKTQAPPVLYCIGDPKVGAGGGLAIIGSRDMDENGLETTRCIASEAVKYRITIVSGGARGVDQTAMMTALEAGGTSIGVLADSLLKESLSKRYRRFLADGRLFLMSPWHPTAGFQIGTAMGRNKLIYAMADSALIMSSSLRAGGTWAGAEEELKRGNHRPVHVHGSTCPPNVREALLTLGAMNFPAEFFSSRIPLSLQQTEMDVDTIAVVTPATVGANGDMTDSSQSPSRGMPGKIQPHRGKAKEDALPVHSGILGEPSTPATKYRVMQDYPDAPMNIASDRIALESRVIALAAEPKKDVDLADACRIPLKEMRSILKDLVTRGVLVRHERPVRYEIPAQAVLWTT